MDVTTNQLNINKQFKSFYEKPYDRANIAHFFTTLEMPAINDQDQVNLEQSISTVKIKKRY